MPKSEREETVSALTSLILSSILDELVLDATLQSHHEVARTGALCKICNTRCSAVHIPPSLSNMASSGQGPTASRSGTPSSNGDTKGTGTNTPTNAKGDGTLYMECIHCSRQISSNRYAPHLSSCMGLSNSRRGVQRSNSKPKFSSEGRSASPSSDHGYNSDDKSPNKGKSKDGSEYTLKRKRQSSPQVSPTKKAKGKSSGSPISRVKADADGSGVASNQPNYSPANKTQSRVPSKLRDSSTVSNLNRASSSSRSSSPEGTSIPTPSSSFTQSPSLPARVIHGGRASRGRPIGTGPPKRPSPPRPPPPPIHFGMQVDEGDETGSSTDTSESS